MDINNRASFSTILNAVEHEIEIYLDNGEQQFPINPNAIIDLVINDTLADWAVSGALSFYFTPESAGTFDKRTGNYKSATTGLKSFAAGNYKFLNDGNDLLRVRVTPKLRSPKKSNDFSIQDTTHWTMSYLFSVYNMEDIDQPAGLEGFAEASTKCLKLYFHDHWKQKLNTNTLEYSTALSQSGLANIENDINTNTYSNYGRIPTGIAIKEMIEKGLEGIATAPNPVGTGPGEWEDGKSSIFYTAPADVSAWESLDFLTRQHLSQEGSTDISDFSILTKEKGPGPNDLGYFTLRPLSYYFEQSTAGGNKPGDWQIEHFFIQSFTGGDSNTIDKYYRAPTTGRASDKVDVKLGKYNSITNFRFVDIAAQTNEDQFTSSPVYSFDFKNRLFRTEFQRNSVFNARDYIGQNYIDRLYRGGGAAAFLPTLNTDKEKKNITPKFSLYGEKNNDDDAFRQLPGIHRLLHLGVFQNACINFRTIGLTHRRPGRFIAIDKTEGAVSGVYEDKLYGQWLVLDVKHSIQAEMYYNDITAIKINNSSI